MPRSAIRTLRVQSSQCADISFNMAGVIGWQNYDHSGQTGACYIGQRVSAFDADGAIYSHLADPDPDNEGLLKYGSTAIRAVMRASALFALRNESLGASLDQILQQRRATWRDRYKHSTDIQGILNTYVPQLLDHLENMHKSAGDRFKALDDVYQNSGPSGVVTQATTKTTAPDTTSTTTVSPVTTISSVVDSGSLAAEFKIIETTVTDAGGTPVQKQETPQTAGIPATLSAAGAWTPVTGPFRTQQIVTSAAGPQAMTSDLQAYIHPKLENAIGYNQAMAALVPEIIRQQTSALKLADTTEIMRSELQAMDLEIRNLQLNYVHTHLTAPIDGIITAIFKDVGESVGIGEAVLRVENDRFVFLVGRVQYQSQLWVGRQIKVHVVSVFEDGSNQDLQGPIVAIRGHEADNDEWEIVVRCENPVINNRRLLPLGYQLDPDTDSFEPQ